MERLSNSPLRIPIMDRYKDRGALTVLGKIESGSVSKGDIITIMPNKLSAEVLGVIVGENKMVKTAKPGENAKLMLKNVEEEQVQRGFVICSSKALIPCQNKFEAIVSVLELLPHKSVFTAGYSAVIHVHTAVEECTVLGLLEQIDKKTGGSVKMKPQFVTAGQLVRLVLECKDNVCVELFSDIPQLGRFTLRDEGKTIAIGKITALAPKKKVAPKN
jgi:peptide chain release factor subunit 3